MIADLWPYIGNFKQTDFDSPDVKHGGEQMNPRLVYLLQALRLLMGKPFIVNSGFRTPEHNRAVGGAPASGHITGEAVDIRTAGWTKRERIDFVLYARKIGFNGVGIASSYIHIDIKPRVASWIYRGGKTPAISVGSESQYV